MLSRINKWIDEVVTRVISQRVASAVSVAVADHLKTIEIDYGSIEIDYSKIEINYRDIDIDYPMIEIDYSEFDIDYSEIEIDHDRIAIDYDQVVIDYERLGETLVNLASKAKRLTAR